MQYLVGSPNIFFFLLPTLIFAGCRRRGINLGYLLRISKRIAFIEVLVQCILDVPACDYPKLWQELWKLANGVCALMI